MPFFLIYNMILKPCNVMSFKNVSRICIAAKFPIFFFKSNKQALYLKSYLIKCIRVDFFCWVNYKSEKTTRIRGTNFHKILLLLKQILHYIFAHLALISYTLVRIGRRTVSRLLLLLQPLHLFLKKNCAWVVLSLQVQQPTEKREGSGTAGCWIR